MSTLDEFVRSGKVRYLGVSNFSGWRLMKSLSVSERYGWSRYVVQQLFYSLAAREAEWELLPLGIDQNLGTVVWSPLAQSRLSGKVRRGRPVDASSRTVAPSETEQSADHEFVYDLVDVLAEVAGELGKSIPQVAINWLLERPTVSSIILGARTEEQLRQNLESDRVEHERRSTRQAGCRERSPAALPVLASAAESGRTCASRRFPLVGARLECTSPTGKAGFWDRRGSNHSPGAPRSHRSASHIGWPVIQAPRYLHREGIHTAGGGFVLRPRSSMATSGRNPETNPATPSPASPGRAAQGARRGAPQQQRRRQHQDEAGVIPVLARTVRAIENSAERGKVNPANRTRFRVVAVLVREERARIKGDKDLSDAERTKELTRLDGIATIMAKTAARDTTLIQLLTDNAPLTPAAQEMRRAMLMEAGGELTPRRPDRRHRGARSSRPSRSARSFRSR